MITCILLAAGSASRFGSQKLLARLADGRTVVEAAVGNLVAANVGQIVVVTRPDSDLIAVVEDCGCEIVINARAGEGMGTSIAAGVAATPDASGWLIALGDMPSIHPETLNAVARALRDGARIVVPVMAGRRGHPVGFSAMYLSQLRSLSGDTGAREILESEAAFIETINVDDAGIFADIDTPADFKL